MIKIDNCQSFINSLSVLIPNSLGTIPLLLVFVLITVATVKLLIAYIKVQLSKNNLMRNRRSNASFAKLLEKLQLTNKTYLIESEMQFAFCLGIRHPKIYISTNLVNLLTHKEAEAVLRHEQYHLRNRDTLTMLIASVGESLLPFFPLISDFLRNYRIEREIKADAEAIHGLSSKKPLISVLKKLLNAPLVTMAPIAAIADHDTLEPRIHALINKDFHFKKFSAKHVLISLCSVFVMGVITLTPVQAVEVHHKGEDVMMICPNNNECLIACKQAYSTNKKNYSEDRMYTPIQ